MDGALRWLRRYAARIVALVALAWIVLVVVLIAVNPVAGTGNPMD